MNEVLETLIRRYPDLECCRADLLKAFEILKTSFQSGGKLLIAGNGGSASDSGHIVGELMKGFMLKRPVSQSIREKLLSNGEEEGGYLADHLQGALPAISLISQTSLLTAFANDVAADMVFAQQVFGYGRPTDVFLGLSTSGNSLNVIRAAQVAKSLGMCTIAMSGQSGGRLFELCDVTIRVPYHLTPDIQEKHLPIYHTLCIMLENEFFG
jgi:D-sedoheptulose 7-phosphate isomerase